MTDTEKPQLNMRKVRRLFTVVVFLALLVFCVVELERPWSESERLGRQEINGTLVESVTGKHHSVIRENAREYCSAKAAEALARKERDRKAEKLAFQECVNDRSKYKAFESSGRVRWVDGQPEWQADTHGLPGDYSVEGRQFRQLLRRIKSNCQLLKSERMLCGLTTSDSGSCVRIGAPFDVGHCEKRYEWRLLDEFKRTQPMKYHAVQFWSHVRRFVRTKPDQAGFWLVVLLLVPPLSGALLFQWLPLGLRRLRTWLYT